MRLLKFYSLFIVLFISSLSKGQDIILLRKGDDRKVKIVAVNESKISFQDYDHPRIKHIFSFPSKWVVAIKYQNGDITNSTGHLISDTEFEYERNHRLGISRMARGIPLVSVGSTAMALGTGMLIGGIVWYNNDAKPGGGSDQFGAWLLGFMGAFVAVLATPLTITGSVAIANARKNKKKADALKATMSFNPVLAPSFSSSASNLNIRPGIGMRIKF